MLQGAPTPCVRSVKGPGAVDCTRYGQLRGRTRSFLRHHTQQLVKAAVVGDSEAILRKITTLKQRAFGAASAAAGGFRSRRGGLKPRAAAALCVCRAVGGPCSVSVASMCAPGSRENFAVKTCSRVKSLVKALL